MMKRSTFRVVPLGQHAQHVLNHVRAASCLCRHEQTAWRGEVAFVGNGRVWAVAFLREVKPVVGKNATGFLWCFDDLREIDSVTAPNYQAPAVFQNGAVCEPQMLAAGAQVLLNRALGRELSEVAEASCDERGQLQLFG